MPQKKRDDDGGMLHRLKEMLVERFSSGVIESVGLHIQELAHRLQELAYRTQEKILQRLYVAGLALLGCVFLVLSLLSYLIDALGWSRTKATLGVGVLLLAMSFMMKQYVVKTRSER